MERNTGFEPATFALAGETPSLFRNRAKPSAGFRWSIPAGEYERLDVGSSYPDSVEHTYVSQFAALAEPIDRLGGYVEECSDVSNRQQRPQPVRRILGERCENLRSPGIRGCSIPSSCDRLRILATRWIGLIRPSKPPPDCSSVLFCSPRTLHPGRWEGGVRASLARKSTSIGGGWGGQLATAKSRASGDQDSSAASSAN